MDERDKELVNLLARCALREQLALKKLYDRLAPFLNAVAFRIVKSQETSNEVLQEGFVQIWRHAASYRPGQTRPLTWITSIIRYRALDRLDLERKHQASEFLEDRCLAPEIAIGASPGSKMEPEQALDQEKMQTRLQACMRELSEEGRQSITLAYLHGCTREEIARRFDTKVNTVKSWLRRAAERLRICLEAKLESRI